MVVVVEVVRAGASAAAVAATAVGPFTTSHLQHQICNMFKSDLVRMLLGHVQLTTQNMLLNPTI